MDAEVCYDGNNLLQSQDGKIDRDDQQPAITRKKRSGEDIGRSSSKSVLHFKQEAKKYAFKVLAQAYFQNAHDRFRLQLEAEWWSSLLVRAHESQ